MNEEAAPVWRVLGENGTALPASLPIALRPWITLSTSMTAQLRRCAGDEPRVDVHRSEPGALLPDEGACFGDAPRTVHSPVHVREVCLWGAGRPLLAARTVYAAARHQADPALASLGERPLGELLFDPASPPHWTLREFARLTPGHPLHALAQRCVPQAHDAFWARRTLFWRAGEPLLVTEIFLPPALPMR